LGIDIDSARLAVAEQHDQQLAALGVEAAFPQAGPIVFHETDGYEWSPRARDLIARSSGKGKSGDAAAVLRELVGESSGLITDILGRLGTTPDALREVLDETDSAEATATTTTEAKGRAGGSIEIFVPAPVDDVWSLLENPARIPEWESSIGTVDQIGQDPAPGTTWTAAAPTSYPDGRPPKIKPPFRRRSVELVSAQRPGTIAWSFGFPDVPRSNPVLTEFILVTTAGGTHVEIRKSWLRRRGWRGLVAFPLRPIQKFLVWINLLHTGSAVSRAFR